MKNLLLCLLSIFSISSVQAANHWFSSSLLTEITSINTHTINLKVLAQDDGKQSAFPVGTRFILSNDKWTKKSGLVDEKIRATILKAILPSGKSQGLDKELTIKPRSTWSRFPLLVFGLPSQKMKLLRGDKLIIFDTMNDDDRTLTAIEDSTL